MTAECPNCKKIMLDCCEQYWKYLKDNNLTMSDVSHSCGQREYICECGYREYGNDILIHTLGDKL